MPTSSKYGPEVYELCLQLCEDRGWSQPRVAKYLFDNGITDKVVDRSTILRWCAKAVGNADKNRTRRQLVAENQVAADLGKIREKLHDLAEADDLDPEATEVTIKVLNGLLALSKEVASVYGIYAPKRKEVAVTTTEAGGVSRKELSEKAEYNQADFEAWVQRQCNGDRVAEDAG